MEDTSSLDRLWDLSPYVCLGLSRGGHGNAVAWPKAFLVPIGAALAEQPNWPSHSSLQVHTLASRSSVRLVRASACRSRRWKSLGDMMAGEKKRKHRKLVTAMNGTFWKGAESRDWSIRLVCLPRPTSCRIPFLSRPSDLHRGRTWCWALGKRSCTRWNNCRKVARTTTGHARTERHIALSSATTWARSVRALCSNTSASVCGRCSPEHLYGQELTNRGIMVSTCENVAAGAPSDVRHRERTGEPRQKGL